MRTILKEKLTGYCTEEKSSVRGLRMDLSHQLVNRRIALRTFRVAKKYRGVVEMRQTVAKVGKTVARII
jgi:hypothetical protein